MADNEFSERLKRIQEQRGGATPSPKAKQPDQTARPTSIKPTKDHRVRNFFICCGIIAVSGGGIFYGANMMAKNSSGVSMTNMVEATKIVLNGSSTISTDRTGPEPLARELDNTGWVFRAPAVASPDGTEINIDQIATGFVPTTPQTAPGQLIAFETNSECTLRRPQAGEVVRNVRLAGSTGETAMHVFSQAHMASALIDQIEGITSGTKGHYKLGTMARGQLEPVDVFVTDQSGPIYLVLQSLSAGAVWNIHLGEGVELAHVAMIGSNSAIAKLPDGVAFEAIRIGDFVRDGGFGSNDEIRPCMVVPWRKPQDHWPAQKKANKGNELYENMTYSFNAGYRAFNAWYTDALGVDAGTNLTAADAASLVLAGPVPETMVTFTPLEGRDVYYSTNDFAVFGDDQLKQIHTDVLTQAAGGDLAMLNPAPMEVAQ